MQPICQRCRLNPCYCGWKLARIKFKSWYLSTDLDTHCHTKCTNLHKLINSRLTSKNTCKWVESKVETSTCPSKQAYARRTNCAWSTSWTTTGLTRDSYMHLEPSIHAKYINWSGCRTSWRQALNMWQFCLYPLSTCCTMFSSIRQVWRRYRDSWNLHVPASHPGWLLLS